MKSIQTSCFGGVRTAFGVLPALFFALAASAAWYDDPSILKKVPLAADAPGTVDPHFMNKAEDDSLLFVNLQASGDNAPTVLIDMQALVDRTVEESAVMVRQVVARPSQGYGAEWKGGAVSAKLGLALTGSGNSSATCAIRTDGVAWTKVGGLLPLATSNGYMIDGLDFSADSRTVYSSVYTDGKRGSIARWTYDAAAGRLVFDKEFATSLARIRNISVHTVGGRELVYCGEGADASAAAKIVAIDVSSDTWTETVVSAGLTGLTGDITNVKLSNEDDANPVMYVLCDSGKLAVCKLAADGLSVSETVKTFDAAALKALSGGTTSAKFRNFEVTKDGKTAFIVNRTDTHNATLCVLGTAGYIASDATAKQVINSGYFINAKTKIEIDFELTEIVSQARLFGQYAAGCSNMVVVYFGDQENNFKFGLGKESFSGVYLAENNTRRNTIIYDGPNNKGYLIQDGVTVATANLTAPHDGTATMPMAIFAETTNANGLSFRNFAVMKLYGLKVYEDDVVVHSYSPCLKGGVPGLVDTKTGEFHSNQSGGGQAFGHGGDIMTLEEDPYIESDGTSAISTGVGAQPGLKIEIDYALTDVTDPTPEGSGHYQQRIFGQDTVSSTPRISIYINNSKNISIATGDGWNAVSTGIAADLRRRKIIIDNVDGVRSFITEGVTNFQATCEDVTTRATRPLGLFGNVANNDGTAFTQYARAKVYGLRIWAKGSLVRDFKPRVIDGVAGFEDVASGGFYTCDGLTASANAPTALSGRSKEGDGYIESDGSFFSVVDTRYFVTPKTKIELDYQLADIVSGAIVLGGYGSSAGISTIVWCKETSNMVLEMHDGSHSGTADNLLSPTVLPDLARHTAVIDGPGRHVSMSAHDGTVEAEADFPESWTLNVNKANWPMLLFGSATDAYGHNKQQARARIYGVKIYEEGELVHNFTPFVKGGVAGFRDEASGEFFSGDGLTAGGNVPAVDDDSYVENPTGGRFFDTGYYVTPTTSIFCDFMLLMQQTGAQQFPFEAGDSVSATNDSKKMFMRMYGNGSTGTGDIAYACGGQLFKSVNIPYAPHVRRQLTLDAYNLKCKVETSGVLVREVSIAAIGSTAQSSTTLKLLCNGNMNANSCKARLYGFKIYEAGALVRDYVPICQNGEFALFDKVEGDVLRKADKSTAFTGDNGVAGLDEAFFAADMRDEDAYIESDGTQGIDLGYLTTPQTRYEIDYQMTAIRGQNRIFGSIGLLNAELYIQGTATGSGNVAFGVGNTWIGQYTSMGADLNRHVAVLDLANHEWGYSGYGMSALTIATTYNRIGNYPLSLFTKGTATTFTGGAAENRTAMRLYAFRIYEAGELLHEYLPYKVGDVVGLYDTMTGDVKTNDIAGGNPFVYGGGLGYGKFAGERRNLVVQPASILVGRNAAGTLSAYAPGAIRYIWTRNGEVLAGADGTTVTVLWERRRDAALPDIYAVTPVFLVGGVEVLGEGAEAQVTMTPLGTVLRLR